MPSHRGFCTSPTMRGIKHDSSLNDGFERVTHSMTLDCHRKEMHRERILEKAEAPGFCSRQACTCVNMTNEHTIEFRIFRGTLKYDTLIAKLQMVKYICDLAVFLSDTVIGAFLACLCGEYIGKEKLQCELIEAQAALTREEISEEKNRELFRKAEQQLRSGILSDRRSIIDRFVDKATVCPDRVEILMKVISDYTLKETVRS